MDTTKDSAATRTPTTREDRGLQLFRDHAGEIERIGPHLYSVPSCSGDGVHQVCVREGYEACTCRDFEHRGEEVHCKHIEAAKVWKSRAGECVVCGVHRLMRELVEVQDWHESLTWFVGDILCKGCGRRAGVS